MSKEIAEQMLENYPPGCNVARLARAFLDLVEERARAECLDAKNKELRYKNALLRGAVQTATDESERLDEENKDLHAENAKIRELLRVTTHGLKLPNKVDTYLLEAQTQRARAERAEREGGEALAELQRLRGEYERAFSAWQIEKAHAERAERERDELLEVVAEIRDIVA